MSKKEGEKIVKFKDLAIAIQRMWYVKNKRGSSRNTGKLHHLKIIQKISEIHTRNERQKGSKTTAILGCVYIFREVLTQKYKPVIMGR